MQLHAIPFFCVPRLGKRQVLRAQLFKGDAAISVVPMTDWVLVRGAAVATT